MIFFKYQDIKDYGSNVINYYNNSFLNNICTFEIYDLIDINHLVIKVTITNTDWYAKYKIKIDRHKSITKAKYLRLCEDIYCGIIDLIADVFNTWVMSEGYNKKKLVEFIKESYNGFSERDFKSCLTRS